MIGAWCARFDGERQVTRWHLIESMIVDRMVTHCGRQMPVQNRNGHLLTDAAPAPTSKCERCAR